MSIRTELFDKYAIVRIDREDKLNAIDMEHLTNLYKTVSAINKNKRIRTVIITGTGKSFCAGADLSAVRNFDLEEARSFSELGHKLMNLMERSDKLFISAINGYAFGGGLELAMATDLRFATKFAKLGQTEINVGVVTGWGGSIRLPKYVGLGKARELIFLGTVLTAEESKSLGIVNLIVDDPVKESVNIANTMSRKNPDAVTAYKRLLNKSSSKIEIAEFAKLIPKTNTKEGISAFLEKRDPEFK
ncbi:MAG: enoyl-CoA hydratase/isomerase family protein [Thermoplasmata archaeon]